MAYTVVSVFPQNADTEEIKNELKRSGFDEADITISKSTIESSPDHFIADDQTKGFFDYVFEGNKEISDAYHKHSIGKTNIIVYTKDLEGAISAKSILNRNGALDVERKDSNDKKDIPEGMSENEYNGIIAKARHNLYFLGSDRVYHSNVVKGMDDPMDDLGSED